CKELLEQSLARFLGNTNSVIAHANANDTIGVPLCGDYYFAAAQWRVAHRIERINNEIEQDLLQLNWIAFNHWQIWVQKSTQLAGVKHGTRFYHAHHADYNIV